MAPVSACWQKLVQLAAAFFLAIRSLPGALTNAAGFRLKSMDGREQVSLSTVQVAAFRDAAPDYKGLRLSL